MARRKGSKQRTRGRSGTAETRDPVTVTFCETVERTVPERATVVVVTRGDPALLRLGDRTGWHFPQRTDGVYAGYYPPDSAAAITHLESLRERGAQFLAFPATALWWLEHYEELAAHLEIRYERIVYDESQGAIYALVERPARETARRQNGASPRGGERERVAQGAPAEALDGVRALFDAAYYSEQAGIEFASEDAALAHYLENGAESGHDPNPYFDTAYYYGQRPNLRERGVNPLVHYVAPPADGKRADPNPLFVNAYYVQTYPDVESSGQSPLEHFLGRDASEGRYVSHIHKNAFDRLRQSSVKGLTRGNWKRGAVLIFTSGNEHDRDFDLAEGTRLLAEDHRLDSVVVAERRTGVAALEGNAKLFVLEDYELACQIFRPSALRMFARTLWRLRPLLALSELPEVIPTLRSGGIRTYDLNDPDHVTSEGTRGLLERGVRELGLGRGVAGPEYARPKQQITKVMMLCSDWGVSGVNAALEAVGGELVRRGWELEILFTRDSRYVLASAGDGAHLPSLPYRFLERPRSGVDGLWEGLIAEVQRSSPCIALLAYDQVANCIAPALTDEVGVVSWIQADDGDYYEQVYRLGRYCNAVVCVSSHIRDTAAALNPTISERLHVIHNTSVSEQDIVARRTRAAQMRMVYTGRLVQYQKRVLDYVELARALDRTGVPYEITLIGDFTAREGAQEVFEERGREHLDDGRIALLGRQPRETILHELAHSAFFVLLSDFEGLPLSLVEAMAAGCVPIVADSPSGVPELVTSGYDGYIMSGRDYDAWAEFLVALWNDREGLSRLSRHARKTVRAAFTIEHIGSQFDELLRQIADEVVSGRYQRPPALTWGPDRSPAGDVLPSPNLFLPGYLARYPGLS